MTTLVHVPTAADHPSERRDVRLPAGRFAAAGRLSLLDPQILQDGDRVRQALVADRQRDDVGARVDAGPEAAASTAESAAATALLPRRRVRLQVPHDAVDPLTLRAFDRPYRAAGVVRDRDRHAAGRRGL